MEDATDGKLTDGDARKGNPKYKFKIEDEDYKWPTQFITSAEIRTLGPGIPDNMDLYLKVKGSPGRLVTREERIDLGQKGIEKFYAQDASSEAGSR